MSETVTTYCSICERETEQEPFLTGGTDWEYGVPGTFNQVRCTECGLVRMHPMPSLEEVVTFYPDSYHGYQEGGATSALTKFLIQKNLKAREAFYKSLIGNDGHILDVGSGEGSHFDTWTENTNWKISGFEFHEGAAALGRSRGRDIEHATIETYDPKGKTFDLIIMNHLLEHVIDPLDTVRRGFELLKPGGVIVGETPNIASLDFALFGKYWGGCHWPRHLHQFTPKTHRTMFEKAEFASVTFSYPLHTGHWALAFQNFLQSKKLTKTTLTNGRSWYYPFLLLATVPPNLVQKMTGYTGIIGFVAKKPE